MTAHVTHRQWHSRVKHLLDLTERNPKRAARGFHRLARAVDNGLKGGVHDWHLMQSLSLASLGEAASGDHRAAAHTLSRVVEHQRMLLAGEQRAYVSACAAAAIEFAAAGDRRAARRAIRASEPWARMLRPQEKLLQRVRALLRPRRRQGSSARREKL
jgi:hypothetical protein